MIAFIRNLSREKGIIDQRLLTVERKTGLRRMMIDSIKAPHEVKMPGLTTELTVCQDLESCLLFFRDQIVNCFILNSSQLFL